MPIESAVSIGMFDDDSGSIPVTDSCKYYTPFAGGPYRGADRNCDISAAVEETFAASKRIDPPSNSRRHDTVLYRQVTIRKRNERQRQQHHCQNQYCFQTTIPSFRVMVRSA